MSIISYPYTSIEGDRKVTASQMAEGLDALASPGVSTTNGDFVCGKVTDTMQISVSPGKAFIAGHPVSVDAAETVTLDEGDPVNPRADIVALESNNGTEHREAFINVVKGVPAASPVDPDITQTEALWQTPLCRVVVPAGAATLNMATLTDMREFSYGKHKHRTADLDDGAITASKLSDSAVTASKIADSAVTEGKINTGAVTEIKINSGAVTEGKIGTGAVTATKIGTGAVTETKISDGAVTAAKVEPGHVVGARFTRNSTQAIPSGTETAIIWNAWPFDSDTSKDDSHLTRMVCKYDGNYTIYVKAMLLAISSTNFYQIYIKKNGVTLLSNTVVGAANDFNAHAFIDNVALWENDYIEAFIEHTIGTTKYAFDMMLSMRRNMF